MGRLKDSCSRSGYISCIKPLNAIPDERWSKGHRVKCPSCGKIVKLRYPPSGGSVYFMVPHHNRLKEK